MKTLRYAIEALLLHLLFLIFRLLPVDSASNFGGWLGKTIGPKLATSRKALRNLQNALPDLSEEEQGQAIAGMWENLGRVIAEYPHLKFITENRVTVLGDDILKKQIEQKNGGVLFGAHLGNWEVGACFTPVLFDQPLDMTYRAPNNPWVDRLLLKSRLIHENIKAHPKSRVAGKALIDALKNKRFVGVLLDQKYNEGVAVPFFGVDAMTNPVFVQLCQKYKCPFIPARCERKDGANFEIEIFEPISVFDEQGNARAIEDVLKEAHIHMEEWIKKTPEQWLWLHRRWDSQKLSN